MKERFRKFLGVEPSEFGPVTMLLACSFFMGLFLATVTVASQTLFLNHFIEKTDLPVALVIAGGIGVVATLIFNIFQGRISFGVLGSFSLLVLVALTAFLEFGEGYFSDVNDLYYYGFTLVLTFTFICNLVFWGAFNRMFNLRQVKRVIGSVDVGTDIASIIAFFSIPVLLALKIVELTSLFTIGLASVTCFLLLFIVLSSKYLKAGQSVIGSEKENKKISIFKFFRFRYLLLISLFIIASTAALRFIDYSFLNATSQQFEPNELANFLSLFEGTIVVFGFAFGTFAADRVTQDYGLRVSLIANPILLFIFTGGALVLGLTFGYDKGISGDSVVFFFIMIAMSKLFVNSLRDSMDSSVLKNYYIPIDKRIRIDAQTKIEGIVTALATAVGGGLIVLINKFEYSNLLTITLVTFPLLAIWYLVINRMYGGYRDTLQNSLKQNRSSVEKDIVKEFTLDSVLEKETKGTIEDKVIYGLRLMEKLQPALFETSILQLANSDLRKVKQFAVEKIEALGINQDMTDNEMKGLALRAAGESEDSDLLSISPERLMKLSKSVKQTDRLLAVKMMRKLVSPRTIFILLELLRDADSKVRNEALITARKIKRPETWPLLIELISSPAFGHHAVAALKESGEAVLPYLEAAFHKSGQSNMVMLKLVQTMGHIGGKEGMQLLWKKIDYPDKRIVKQILYTLRYINYQATGREAREIIELLDVEIGKTLWNMAALFELPDEEHFKYLREALKEEVEDNFDQVSMLMSLLYDPQSVQLVRENIESGTPDGIAYALELMDLFVDKDLKPKLYPLFDDLSIPDKLERLQTYYPRESYTPIQVVNYVLNRDFNYNNRWTKTCAVHSSAFIPDFRVSRGLISQMFNQDKFLQETAAWVIFNKDKHQYNVVSQRLPHRDKKFLDNAIENNQLLNGLDDGFFLGIEMVLFIKELAVFKNIHGSIMCDLADKIIPLDLKTREKLAFNPAEESPILICALGEVRLKVGDETVVTLKKGDVFGNLFHDNVSIQLTEAETTERTVLFRINMVDFYYVMANHHELVQGLINNITKKTLTS